MRRIITSLIAVAAAIVAVAGTPQEDIAARLWRSASNHHTYHASNLPALTAAPAGYEAFHIEHYGRHGSRWLSRATSYERPVEILSKDRRGGYLTEQGERLLTVLQQVNAASRKRAGELSDKGAEQHQVIAKRMFDNFPTVFTDDAVVDARSTVVIRCILSMQNATMTLRTLNPRMHITTDASYHDMYYMGYGHGEDTLANHIGQEVNRLTDSLYRTCVNSDRFIKQIYSHPELVDKADAQRLMRDVFDIAGSLQNHHAFDDLDLYHLFTNDEIFELWRLRNIDWYVHRANSPVNGNRMPFIARDLLRDFIAKADNAIATGQHGASLRFGHESIVLPLACMLEINDINLSTDDLDNLHNQWKSYEVIPKACNVQMIFYSNGTDDVLVKALYNEREAKLPVDTDCAPYYHWKDLKRYYEAKCNTHIDWAAPASVK